MIFKSTFIIWNRLSNRGGGLLITLLFFLCLISVDGTDCSASSTSASIYGTYAYCVNGQYLCDPYATIAKRGCDVSSP